MSDDNCLFCKIRDGQITAAITEISTMTAAKPRRHPSPDGTATPSASMCISRLATPSTLTGAITVSAHPSAFNVNNPKFGGVSITTCL